MAKRWYIVHALSNFEKRAAENIKKQAELKGLVSYIDEVLVPTETVVQMKPGGRKSQREKTFFPGYILVKAELTDAVFHLIKSVDKVTGFLGANNNPTPISETEARRILQQVEEGVEKPANTVRFEVGEQVRVVDGPFASFNGTVEGVDEPKSRLKVAVAIFGRATPVELEYGQVEKL